MARRTGRLGVAPLVAPLIGIKGHIDGPRQRLSRAEPRDLALLQHERVRLRPPRHGSVRQGPVSGPHHGSLPFGATVGVDVAFGDYCLWRPVRRYHHRRTWSRIADANAWPIGVAISRSPRARGSRPGRGASCATDPET